MVLEVRILGVDFECFDEKVLLFCVISWKIFFKWVVCKGFFIMNELWIVWRVVLMGLWVFEVII